MSNIVSDVISKSEQASSSSTTGPNVKLVQLGLDSRILSKLMKIKVLTYQDYLKRKPAVQRALGDEKMNEVESKVSEFHKLCYLQPKRAFDLLEAQVKTNYITSFCRKIDEQLNGGLKHKTIYELVGAPGSGKTQLCLQILANAFISKSIQGISCEHAVFIDTEYSFFNDRFQTILSKTVSHCRYLNPKLKNDSKFSVEELRKRIKAYRCTHVTELIDILETVVVDARSASGNIQLLIIDSIASPFRLPDFESVKQRCNCLATISFLLLQIVRLTNACIVLTNHITTKLVEECGSTVGSYFVPLLGDSWSTTANVRILLSEDAHGRKLSVFKGLASVKKNKIDNSSTESCSFQITKGGIRDTV